jgi:uncharacterized phage protein (TIGR02218 family)
MRVIPVGLQAELDTNSPRIARLIKLTTQQGVTYGWTDHDTDLVVDSVVYTPAPGLNAIKFVSTGDAQVSTQELGAAVIEVPDADLQDGKFDDAQVEAAWCSWADPSAGRLIVFKGRIGQIGWSEDGFQVELVSHMKLLEKNIGITYTSACRHELFGSVGPGKIGACGVASGAFTFTGAVGTINVAKWKFDITGAASTQAEAFFANGVLTFTSGNNSGLSVVVKKNPVGSVELFLPTAFTIGVGDTFTVKAGCDKSLATCKSKFNNVANFGGFPHINTDVTFR